MISKEEVFRLATLSRLNFNDNEIPVIIKKMSSIIETIDQLSYIECDNIRPLTSVCEQDSFMKNDEVTEQDISNELFSNAPGKTSEIAKNIKYFIVPKVIE